MADASLYGVRQASKTKVKTVSSSTSIAFSTNLASLISSSTSNPTFTSGRPRKSKTKSDISNSHNKNVKKRHAADMLPHEDGEQRHKSEADIGGAVDSATLHRSKRKLQEKARLYTQMKRGEYVRGERDGDGSLVDFDRKWAEEEARGARSEEDNSSGSDDAISDGNEGDLVEYIDEFGRTRQGTKAEAAREERRRRIAANAAEEEERFSARAQIPDNIIYGDTVQHHAFNPDEVIADRMAEIAKKRDRSATPPPETHYDANAEVRSKGTGFYNFSNDAEERRREMEALEKERADTERNRTEREQKKEDRKRMIEERRRVIAEQRGKAQADKFLDNLDLIPQAPSG